MQTSFFLYAHTMTFEMQLIFEHFFRQEHSFLIFILLTIFNGRLLELLNVRIQEYKDSMILLVSFLRFLAFKSNCNRSNFVFK